MAPAKKNMLKRHCWRILFMREGSQNRRRQGDGSRQLFFVEEPPSRLRGI